MVAAETMVIVRREKTIRVNKNCRIEGIFSDFRGLFASISCFSLI